MRIGRGFALPGVALAVLESKAEGSNISLVPERTNTCPPQKRAASTSAAAKEGFVAASPSRVLRDGEGTVSGHLRM
jgi:hypothetical protein